MPDPSSLWSGFNAMHCACDEGHEDIIDILWEHCPSLVEPVELLRVVSNGEKHTLEPVNPKKINREINQHCTDMTEYYDPEEVPELEHVRSLQLRYCRDNGLL